MRLIFFLFVFVYSNIQAQMCVIEHELDYSNIYTCVYEYEDSSNAITLYNTIFDSIPFSKVSSDYIHKGFSKSSYILKLPIQNKTKKQIEYYFSIKNPGLQEIIFIESYKNEVFQMQQVGERYVFNKRKLEDNNYTFQLTVPAQEIRNFYFIIRNYGNIVQIPMTIETFQDYHNSKLHTYFLLSFFYGLLLFAFIFNVILYFSFKDKIYLITSGFILSLFLYIFTIDGFSFKYLWNHNTWLASRAAYIIAIISIMLQCYTIQLFYNLHVTYKSWYKVLQVLYVILIVLLGICWLPYSYFVVSNYVLYGIILIIMMFVTYMSVHIAMQKVQHPKLMMYANCILLCTYIMVLIHNTGIIYLDVIQVFNGKLGVSFLVLFISAAVSERFRNLLMRSKEKLEFEVKLRTIEIEAQKDYLFVQKERILLQNSELNESIRYASKIQQGIFPSIEFFQSLLPKSFIFFKPKDIISGDFYWISVKRGKIIIACADCTGHGIPGAFLSMLGISYLNTIVNEQGITRPDAILNFLRANIIKTLWKNTEQEPMYDGMNISLCSYDVKLKILEYSGAYNPFYIVRQKSIIKLEPDRMPIGVHIYDKPFSVHKIQLEKKDRVYLFTDGYVDQIGGLDNKKLKRTGFKDLLLSIQGRSIQKQAHKIEQFFNTWKQHNDQTDDVTVIGFEVD